MYKHWGAACGTTRFAHRDKALALCMNPLMLPPYACFPLFDRRSMHWTHARMGKEGSTTGRSDCQ